MVKVRVTKEYLIRVFDKAIESFDANGWTQKVYQNKIGQRCVAGHIAYGADALTPCGNGGTLSPKDYAMVDFFFCENALEFFMEANDLIPRYDDSGEIIGVWNDSPERTLGEVRAALVRAREKAAEQKP